MAAKYKPYTKKLPYTYIQGVYPTLACLEKQPKIIKEILLHTKGIRNEGIEKIHMLANTSHIAIRYADKEINTIASENTYAVTIIEKSTQSLHKYNHVMLVHPDDMGNIGTIMRTMLGFDMHDLAIITPAVDIFHPKVIRASMGALCSLRIQLFPDIEAYQEAYTNKLYGFSLHTNALLQQATFHEPYTLVFGNEGAGIPQQEEKHMELIKIPQSDAIDSFSLPVSVAIALYHISSYHP